MEHFASVGPSVTWEVLVVLEEMSTSLGIPHSPISAQDGCGAHQPRFFGRLDPLPFIYSSIDVCCTLGGHYVAQAGLEHLILLPLSPKCMDDQCIGLLYNVQLGVTAQAFEVKQKERNIRFQPLQWYTRAMLAFRRLWQEDGHSEFQG